MKKGLLLALAILFVFCCAGCSGQRPVHKLDNDEFDIYNASGDKLANVLDEGTIVFSTFVEEVGSAYTKRGIQDYSSTLEETKEAYKDIWDKPFMSEDDARYFTNGTKLLLISYSDPSRVSITTKTSEAFVGTELWRILSFTQQEESGEYTAKSDSEMAYRQEYIKKGKELKEKMTEVQKETFDLLARDSLNMNINGINEMGIVFKVQELDSYTSEQKKAAQDILYMLWEQDWPELQRNI